MGRKKVGAKPNLSSALRLNIAVFLKKPKSLLSFLTLFVCISLQPLQIPQPSFASPLRPQILCVRAMGDSYWRYSDARQQGPSPPVSSYVGKRSRSDYDIPSGHDLSSYYSRDEDRGIRDTETIGASYDRYLNSAQISSYGGQSTTRPVSGKVSSQPVDDLRLMSMGSVDRRASVKEQTLGFGGVRSENPLPRDASSTLYVEGLPPNCSRREVAHIFRPFIGYKEVRLVSKESKLPGGDPLVLCFVDFQSPAHAATAMDALQGYKFDEHDRDSAHLRLQFARYPGARSGGGHRGKR